MVDEKLKDLLTRLLPIVDRGYENRSQLKQMGLRCFQVQDEVIRYFCGSDDVYQEELKFRIMENKHTITHGRYMADYFLKSQKLANEESMMFQEEWRAVLSPFWKKFMKNEQQFPSRFERVMAKFSTMHENAWQEESSVFSLKAYDYAQYSDLDFADTVISDLYSKLGFVINRSLASKTQRVYKKKLNKNYSIYYQFDLYGFYRKEGRETKSIDCWFGIMENPKKSMRITNPKFNKSLFNYSLFFPVNIVGLNQYLKRFRSKEELGSILNINYSLYNLLVEYGFEANLKSAI